MSSKVVLHEPPKNDRLLLSWEPHQVASVEQIMDSYSKEELMEMAKAIIRHTEARGYNIGWTLGKSSRKQDVAEFLFHSIFNPPPDIVSPLPGLQSVHVLVLRAPAADQS